MSFEDTAIDYSQALFRRRRYGMAIRHFNSNETPIKTYDSRIANEDYLNDNSMYQTNQEPEQKSKTTVQTNSNTFDVPDDMANTNIKTVKTDINNLKVTYIDKEGNEIIKSGGHKAWRTNNPGNLSFSSLEAAKKSGAVGVWSDGKHHFAIFESREAGEKALRNKLSERRFSRYSDNRKRPIGNMIGEIYAPASDNNNVENYKRLLSKNGVDINKSVEELTHDEVTNLIKAISLVEGNKAGQLITKNNTQNNILGS